jgi:hypothetical protein
MSSRRRAALKALALGIAIVFPARMALAQSVDLQRDHGAVLIASVAKDAPAIAPAPTNSRGSSGIAMQLGAWVAATDDNGELPFMIVDKLDARVFAFNPKGDFLGSAPVLLGIAHGDDAASGIGALKLSQMSLDQRTTPAGRFMAKFGPAGGHGQVLWVDFRDGIALHPVMSVSPSEHRLERIKSSDPEQHRISYGCINVPAAFYHDVVLPALTGGAAVVYVMPDTKAVADVFPAFASTLGDGHDAAAVLAGR